MIRNPSIKELESSATMRVLLDKLRDPNRFQYTDALHLSTYAINDILTECAINKELWAKIRGRRSYIFHLPTNRIVAEIGIITDAAGISYGRPMRKRLRIELFGRGGRSLKDPTVGDLSVSAMKLGLTRHDRNKFKMHRPKKEVSNA